jgi:hypothetical protein
LGYVLDGKKRVRAGPSTKLIDFKELWDMLRSKDESDLEKMKWVWEKDDRYLNPNSEVTSSNQG